MSVYQKLINLDKVFRQLEKPPIVLNDIRTTTEEEKTELNNRIWTLYQTGVMDSVAKCDCGKISGNFNIGVTCNVCNTEVVSPMYQDLEPILWVRSPNGVEKLINPHIWYILTKAFSISNFSIIRWLCDTTAQKPNREFRELKIIQDMGIQRGYNYFVRNFHEIIDKLSSLKTFSKPPKSDNIALIKRILKEYPDCIFTSYIPMPNKLLVVIEDTNMGRYIDYVYFSLIDAIQMIASIDTVRTRSKKQKVKEKPTTINASEMFGIQPDDGETHFINLTEKGIESSPDFLDDNTSVWKKENRTARMLNAIATFNSNFYKEVLGSKPGMIRKHLFSSRVNFSMRAVITSITVPHDKDELHIPWTSAVGTLRYHILNKLSKRGFKANEAIEFINHYARVYHPLLDEIFEELIRESIHVDPEDGETKIGIPCTLCRNPSLGRGSIINFRITAVRKDPSVLSLGLSILAVKPLNADFILSPVYNNGCVSVSI